MAHPPSLHPGGRGSSRRNLCSGRRRGPSRPRDRRRCSPRTPCRIEAGVRPVSLAGHIGSADLQPRHRPAPISLRQRPAGRDKLLLGAVRAAYADHLPRDRFPVLALFLSVPPARRRRQRPSGQGGGALPRSRPRPRLDVSAIRRRWIAPPRGRRRAMPRSRLCVLARSASVLRVSTDSDWDWRASPAAARRPCRAGSGRLRSLRARRPMRAGRRPPDAGRWTGLSAPHGRSSTRPISWRRPVTASSSSTSMPPMSASSMSG